MQKRVVIVTVAIAGTYVVASPHCRSDPFFTAKHTPDPSFDFGLKAPQFEQPDAVLYDKGAHLLLNLRERGVEDID